MIPPACPAAETSRRQTDWDRHRERAIATGMLQVIEPEPEPHTIIHPKTGKRLVYHEEPEVSEI